MDELIRTGLGLVVQSNALVAVAGHIAVGTRLACRFRNRKSISVSCAWSLCSILSNLNLKTDLI